MRFYKLRVTPNAANIASTFNESFKPEIIAEANDPFRVNWVDNSEKPFYVGEEVTAHIPYHSLIGFIDNVFVRLYVFRTRKH